MGKLRYDNPGGLIAGSVILELIAVLAVGLRFYTRWWKRQRVLVSDWLILVASILATGMTVIEIYGVKVEALGYPLGGTIEDPRAVTGRLNKAKHIELAYLLLGIATLGFIKLSVCFLYWQLFAKVIFRRFLIVWIIIIIVWATSFVLAGLLECGSHLTALFGDPQEYLDHCGSAIPSGWAMVGSDMATDLITLAIPIPAVLRLQMPTHKKVLTLITFMIGAFSVAASVVKSYIYISASLGLYTEDAICLSIWNLVEVQVGIIAASGPTLRLVLSHMLPTESLSSLVHFSKKNKSVQSSDLPSFVKLSESEENFASGRQNSFKADQFEMQTTITAATPVTHV
ncbi:hypothetical protein F5B19DRAFT_491014 [Rostrohypoxylon terebratum]|nr:hypothetical protein F5B19DRAFT_491014 [Rostrohypoxylon terebratum]